MSRFTKISQDTFDELQVDAGVLLKNFDPINPAEPADSDIITATTGGVNASCVPTYSDWGEDVDNAPNNTKEFKHLDGWECKFSTTALGTSQEMIRLSLGAADATGATYALTSDTALVTGKTYYTRSGSGTAQSPYVYTPVASPVVADIGSYYEMTSADGKVTPRAQLDQGDFEDDLWWVGDRADGGLVAIRLINALSTGGFSLQTTKNGKGTFSLELTGHYSLSALSVVPMEFYSMEGAA